MAVDVAYFETERRGGNNEKSKLNNVRIKRIQVVFLRFFFFFAKIRKNKFPRKFSPQKFTPLAKLSYKHVESWCHLVKIFLSFRNQTRGMCIK